jgi:hypothetical protein
MTDFPTHDPDDGLVQVPTADMLVSTTLLIVMSTIWIQEQQLIFISYSCYIILFLQFLPLLIRGFPNDKNFSGSGIFCGMSFKTFEEEQ